MQNETSSGKCVVILGGGPNRIGQGIEFDYCCCHASYALRDLGYESVMVNSNPETVSTDYDTSTRLYFEPLTREDVMNIIEREKPIGVIVQLGGQTPLNLAVPLEEAGVQILGTSPDSIDRAEDRERFRQVLDKLGLKQAPSGTATSYEEARKIAHEIGYPALVRPSYVLGGRAMAICYDDSELKVYMAKAVDASPDHPVLIDKFLEDAIEVDVDCIADGETVVVGGYMEHIEEAGIHSGDSACAIPPISLSPEIVDELRRQTHALAREFDVKGVMNVQYAIREDVVYVLEVNPRASRTIPFVSKVIGVSLPNLATKVMMGVTLKELGFTEEVAVDHVAVKEAVLPFSRFPGVDATLSPEMKSTGEVMGIDTSFPMAFAKAQLGAGQELPTSGTVFISVCDRDKRHVAGVATRFAEMGFKMLATSGTARAIKEVDVPVEEIKKVSEGQPNIIDCMKNDDVDLIINTPSGKIGRRDEIHMRSSAIAYSVPLVTTVAAAEATVGAIDALRKQEFRVKSLQEFHADIGTDSGTNEGIVEIDRYVENEGIQVGAVPEGLILSIQVGQNFLAAVRFFGEDGDQVGGVTAVVMAYADGLKAGDVEPARLAVDVDADASVQIDQGAGRCDGFALGIAHGDDGFLVKAAFAKGDKLGDDVVPGDGLSGLGGSDIGFGNGDGQDFAQVDVGEDFVFEVAFLKVFGNVGFFGVLEIFSLEGDDLFFFRKAKDADHALVGGQFPDVGVKHNDVYEGF